MIRLILGVSILLLVSGQANAALIKYTVAGDLSLFEGTDAYSLDGASFVWEINADTSLPRSGPDTQTGCCSIVRDYPSLTSVVTFSNRSNGATDTTINPTSAMLQAVRSRYSVTNWSVSVSPVPVPAAVWLFGTALIGLVGMSRRRKVA